MLRRFLAVLLILSSTVLAGFDVLEDLDLPGVLNLHRSTVPSIPAAGNTGSLTNDIVESAASLRPHPSDLLEQPILQQQTIEVTTSDFARNRKIHKRNRVFLI
jgi:hypothetical protein